jgi:serine/threonine-protein kinase RsbW
MAKGSAHGVANPPQFLLEVTNTALTGKRVPVIENLTIGSGSSCSVRAQGKGMATIHARFYRDREGAFFVEVGESDAHIFVNGKDVLRSELHHHDALVIGPIRFKVIDQRSKAKVENRLDELLGKLEEEAANEVYDFAREDLFYLTTKDPMLRQQINFTIPSRDRFIDQAQAFLARLVRQSGMDEMKVEAFMTCAKELILNAHRHGHQYDESKTIAIGYKDRGDSVSLKIKDQGTGFDHEKLLSDVKEQSAAAAARARYQSGGFGGLGFQMITRLADDLRYNEMGNEVTDLIHNEF